LTTFAPTDVSSVASMLAFLREVPAGPEDRRGITTA
jgi:hypothetical protein